MDDPAGMDEQDATEEQDRTEEQDTSDEKDSGDEQETESGDDVEKIEAEREERLAPENRPENAEVDNSKRDFDPATGTFTDSEEHDEAEPKFVPDEEL